MSKKAHKTSKIRFSIELDENNIPTEIEWKASDSDHKENKKAKSLNIAMWDKEERNTLSISLWTQQMLVEEMESHYLQSMIVMAENYQKATGQGFVLEEVKQFCDTLAKKITASKQQEANN